MRPTLAAMKAFLQNTPETARLLFMKAAGPLTRLKPIFLLLRQKLLDLAKPRFFHASDGGAGPSLVLYNYRRDRLKLVKYRRAQRRQNKRVMHEPQRGFSVVQPRGPRPPIT